MYNIKTILLVEDEVILSMSNEMLLSRAGYKVEKSYNGEEAVELIKSEKDIDLILMDIDLGYGMDGTQAAHEILNIRDIPIIFLTSHSEQKMVEKVKNITRYGYVLKNAGEFVLLEAITMAEELFSAHMILKKKNEKLIETNKQLCESKSIISASKNKYQMLFDNIKLGFALHEMIYDENEIAVDYRFLDLNSAFETITGLEASKTIGKTVLERLPETEHYWIETYDKVLKTGEKIEYQNYSRNLGKYFSVTAFKVDTNIFAVLVEDTTARLIIENMLKASKSNLDKVLESVDEAIITVDQDLNIIFMNKNAEELTGLNSFSCSGKQIDKFIEFPNIKNGFNADLNLILKDSKFQQYLIPELLKVTNGIELYFTGKLTLLDNLEKKNIIFSFNKVNENYSLEKGNYQKRIDRMQRLSGILFTIKKLFSLMNREKDIQTLADAVCLKLVENRDYFNAWIILYNDYGQVETVRNAGVGVSFQDLSCMFQKGLTPICAAKAIEEDDVILTENPKDTCLDCPLSESYENRSALTARIEHEGQLIGIMSASIKKDDAEYFDEQILFKQVADELATTIIHLREQQKTDRLLQIIHSVPNPMSFVSLDYTYLTVNKAYMAYYSYDCDTIIGKKVSDFIDKEIFEDSIKTNLDLCFSGKVQNYDCRVNFVGQPDIKWMRMLYTPAYDEYGNVIGAISHGTDITEVKLREENRLLIDLPDASRTQEDHYLKDELYRLVSDNSAIFDFIQAGSLDGIWYWDLLNQENEWMSPQFWELLGYDPEKMKHSPSEWQSLIHPDDLEVANTNFKKHLKDPNHPYDQEVRYTHKDGSTVWVRCRGIAIRDKNGTPVRMLGAHNDLTSLKKVISEKDKLKSEADHRIKNNLLLISSLINIQKEKSECNSKFETIKAQIDGISFIHDHLSKMDSYNQINMEIFLKRLLDNINSIYRDLAISLNYELEPIELDSKTAVHMSIIVNELITNAIKHAAIEDQELEIYIKLNKTPDTIILLVGNNGQPFLISLDEAMAKSTGLMMINSIVKGIKGEFFLKTTDNTEFEIRMSNAEI